MNITLPDLALVVLIGASGSGKSTFASTHFADTEVLSSDTCRAWVDDDPTSQDATEDAFAVLHEITRRRLDRKRLTVVDATNVQRFAREPLIEIAREYHVLPVAIVLNLPKKVCHARNDARPDRDLGRHVVRNQYRDLRSSLGSLRAEGFRQVHVLNSEEDVASVSVTRRPLWCDHTDESGPFDIIGDVHGCASELELLLLTLEYEPVETEGDAYFAHPEGRTAVFVGDLTDRGPRNVDVLRLVMAMTHHGAAKMVIGNHDDKLRRALKGNDVTIAHGLEGTLAEFDALDDAERADFSASVQEFLSERPSHLVLDGGDLVVAHAGLREALHGRASRRIRDLAMYGETTGETDENGFPIRHDWAQTYRGEAAVVYGHTPVASAEWVNNTLNVDTGCAFGERLTALRYPERECVSVPARETYADFGRPLREPYAPEETETSTSGDDSAYDLYLDDVHGKRIIETELQGRVTVQAKYSAAALETTTRYAVDLRWLVYLPPTMSPSDTSDQPGMLEHPEEAFHYYRTRGITDVMCQEKHMGSRAVAVVCRDEDVARTRFGVTTGRVGRIYTRSGRAFFNDDDMERALLDRVRAAMTRADLWGELDTGWICLDAELMPWSAKAESLIREQYAATGAAATGSLPDAVSLLAKAAARSDLRESEKTEALHDTYRQRAEDASRFVDAYQQYVWPVASVEDYRLAPFHVMATDGAVHTDRDHHWHMDVIQRLVAAGDDTLFATDTLDVDVTDEDSVEAAVAWWTERTEAGGEGMVVKPRTFVTHGSKGLAQPAVKCRGQEYLRIIYGPSYTEPSNLERLRKRGLGRKRSMARREFALGVEGLHRFVRREPLRRVHECVFGVLALESEPVDPRL